VVLVGDSTMATRTGYGDAFCGLFQWQVRCVNLARGGRSTKSFRADGSWDRVIELLRDRGEARVTYVLIQFGHNDQPGKAERSTDLVTEYPANLRRYIDEVRREGAQPVLVTPLTRRDFAADGTLKDDLAPWAESMKAVARESGVPILDLNGDSVAAVARMGSTQADRLAMAQKPDKAFDHTHVGPEGAGLFARMLAKRMSEVLPQVAAQLAVGAIEPGGRIARPQLTASQARAYSYARVLEPWDPLSAPLTLPFTADLVIDASAPEDSRTFRSVQSAVNTALERAAADPNRRVHILLRPGTYEGLVYIPDTAPPITFHGDGVDAQAVRIRATLDATWTGERLSKVFGAAFKDAPPAVTAMFQSVSSRPTIGTAGSAATWIRSRAFQAHNLTFENGHNKARNDSVKQSQAVAVMLDDADEARFENVRFIGFQDTLYLAATSANRPARAFFNRAYVEGDMDFIFGEATAYFLATEIRSLGDRAISYALAPSTHYRSPHGFVFERCRFTHDGSINARAGTFKLARQWFRSIPAVGKVAILNSTIGAHIDPLRPWADWSVGTPRHRPVQYDSNEHWQRLLAVGIDPVRDLGYAPLTAGPEPFLAEFENSTE